YKHPIGTGPFMWDKRVVGQSVTFKRNPNYWQKGKPYLDSVTWTFVTNENTRELQLRGGQIQVDEFPPFNSISKLQHTQGVTMSLLVGAGAQVESAMGQILQSSLKRLGIDVTFKQEDTSTEFNDVSKQKYQLAFSYWTMDIADPDELVTFSVDPAGGAHSFYTSYKNPTVIALSHQAQRQASTEKRAALYSKIQRIAAQDAFQGFLYYSPYRWAYTN